MLTVLAVVVLSAIGVRPAAAHNALLSTTPADGATVASMPTSVVLHFDLPSGRLGTSIAVLGPSGDIAAGDPQLVDGDVRQAVDPGSPAGRYTVNWRVVSADGHPVQGSFSFSTANRAPGSAPPARPLAATSPPSTGTSGLTVLLVLGAALLAAATAVVVHRVVRSRRPVR